MSSVHLHCHICPKQPDFSDVSHLLTHIGSKGHLSNYFKAQVRSKQNASVRQQLDVYDRWYAEHQIEKLLSQRMVLKDSKKANGVARATKRERSASTKPTKPLQTTNKKVAPTRRPELPAKAEAEAVIDPQLSQPTTVVSRSANPPHPQSRPSSPGFDITSIHHARYPSTGSFYAPTQRPTGATGIEQQRPKAATYTNPAVDGQMGGSGIESEDEPSARQSIGALYPEPPVIQATDAPLETVEAPSTSCKPGRGRPRRVKSYQDTYETEEIAVPRTPELKGIYYPGMSLFDSASAEAQKKRNQRKNESILAQIQQESLEVECNEYIYWPDGSLKMCRFITGDVQSSPFKDDTPPPPPPPKRRRGRKPKIATSSVRQRRLGTADQPQVTQSNAVYGSLANHPNVPTVPPTVHDSLGPAFGNGIASNNSKDGGEEWLLNMNEPPSASHFPFSIFSDPAMRSPGQAGSPVKQHPNPLNPSMSQHHSRSIDNAYMAWLMTSDRSHEARDLPNAVAEGISSSFTGHKTATAGRPILGASQPRPGTRPGNESLHNHARDGHAYQNTMITRPTMALSGSAHPRFRPGKENVPPPLGCIVEAGVSAAYGDHPTEVQKYFMVKDNQGAQISTTLPAEMAFGGMRTPPVYRASLNPLNPNAHLRQSLPYSDNYKPFQSRYASSPPDHRNFATGLPQDSDIKNDGDNDFSM
ncbi:MAG: hypothetical protein Q9221_003251 [Calogaya cf. arnoldii]